MERIQLNADVDMNLWADARSGFLGPNKENKSREKTALTSSVCVRPTLTALRAG